MSASESFGMSTSTYAAAPNALAIASVGFLGLGVFVSLFGLYVVARNMIRQARIPLALFELSTLAFFAHNVVGWASVGKLGSVGETEATWINLGISIFGLAVTTIASVLLARAHYGRPMNDFSIVVDRPYNHNLYW